MRNKSSKNRKREEENEGDAESDHQVARMPRNPERQHASSSSPKRKKRRSNNSSRRRSRHSHSEHRKAAPAAEPDEANLVEQYRVILEGSDNTEERNKARNVLEAAAGNVSMAAQLYWDDYFASQAGAAPPAQQEEEQQQETKLPPRHEDSSSDDDDDDDDDDDNDDDDDSQDRFLQHPHHKLRRSLDGVFGRAANEAPPQNNNNHNHNNMEDDDDLSDDPPEEVPEPPPPQPEHNNNNVVAHDVAESVSVSDDEAGGNGVWRIVGNVVARLEDASRLRRADDDVERRIREAAAAVAKKVSLKVESNTPTQRRRRRRARKRKHTAKHSMDDDDDDQDYISDSEWLHEHEESGGTIQDPLEALWGKGRKPSLEETENANPAPAAEENAAEGNVVADEEADEHPPKNASGIPHSWLSASFSLTAEGGGLALKPPKPEDIDFFTWRQQQNQQRRGVPPPHHCKAITAILAIVNATLLTGASIQGNEVNCTKAQTPFAELTEEQRKGQFESRLTDALAALIFIAAKASLVRKQRAIAKAKAEQASEDKDDDDDDYEFEDSDVEKDEREIKFQKMKRRLNVIPTCTWEDDPTAGMPQALDGPSHRNVQVAASLTNIQDIRLYVLSTIREFMAPGGVALLLETILRIHGTGVIARMMERAKKEQSKAASSTIATNSLICCTCEERQKKILEKNPLPPSARNDPSRLVDTTPPGHECISKELMSLLLTGRVESSWKGWSTKGLEVGILSNTPGQVGWQLARPEQPVWILQGETCYSVLYVEDCIGADRNKVSKLDTSGAVLEFAHWNCWYGQRNKSNLRLIMAAEKWNPPGLASKEPDRWEGCRGPMESRDTVELLKERLRQKKTNMLSAAEQESIEAKETETSIMPEELEAAKAHPEDKLFYPGKHNMWRFDMGVVEKENVVEEENRKSRAVNWVPYHRLSVRHKKMVELKLGPKIRGILWTRWPNAKMDSFTPANEDPPIV